MWRKLLIAVGLVSFAAGAVILWSGEQKPVSQPDALQRFVAAEGRISVKPDHHAVLSAEVAGRIQRIYVDNLSPIKKGQVLAEIYNADLEERIQETGELLRQSEAEYAEAMHGSRGEDIREAMANVQKSRAAVELARSNEDRDRRLRDEGVVSQSRYDVTVSEYKQADSALAAAQEHYNRLSAGERTETIDAARAKMNSRKYALESLKALHEKSFVRSPLNGIVILRSLNASEFADVGDPILEVADLAEIIVEGDVNEMDAGAVAAGQRAVVTADAFPGMEFTGVVYEVSASLKRRSVDPEDPAVVVDQKILPIKVRFDQTVPFKLGMKVDLKIRH